MYPRNFHLTRPARILSSRTKIRYRQKLYDWVSLRISSRPGLGSSSVLEITASQSPAHPGNWLPSMPSCCQVSLRSTSSMIWLLFHARLLRFTARAISKGEVERGCIKSGCAGLARAVSTPAAKNPISTISSFTRRFRILSLLVVHQVFFNVACHRRYRWQWGGFLKRHTYINVDVKHGEACTCLNRRGGVNAQAPYGQNVYSYSKLNPNKLH